MITPSRDTTLKMMENLDDKDLLSLCAIKNKNILKLCSNESFWMNRFMARISKDTIISKPDNISWKRYYLETIIKLEEFTTVLRKVVLGYDEDLHTGDYEIERSTFVDYSLDALFLLRNLLLKFLKHYDEKIPSIGFSIFYPFNVEMLKGFEYSMDLPKEWKEEAIRRGERMLESKYGRSVHAIENNLPLDKEIESEELLKFINDQKLNIPGWKAIYLSGVLDYLLKDLIKQFPPNSTSNEVNEIIENTKLFQVLQSQNIPKR